MCVVLERKEKMKKKQLCAAKNSRHLVSSRQEDNKEAGQQGYLQQESLHCHGMTKQ